MILLLLAAVLAANDLSLPELDALYARRDDPESAEKLDRALEAARAARPDDYSLLWRAARWRCWKAETTASPDEKKLDSDTCWRLADRARVVNPQGAEGQMLAAKGLGLWAEANGVLRSLAAGVDGKLVERMDEAIRLNPDLDSGTPLLMRGRYYQVVPWPRRDLERAERMYLQVLARHPDNLRARYFYADLLAQTGRNQRACEELEKVLASDGKEDPPSARLVKDLALVLRTDLRGR